MKSIFSFLFSFLKFKFFNIGLYQNTDLKDKVSEGCIQEVQLMKDNLNKIEIPTKTIKVNLTDPEHKKIISDILDLYGYPISSESCISKQEKIMHVFGMMAVFQGLQKNNDLLYSFLSKEDVLDAESLCRLYFKRNGYHIIPTESEIEDPKVFNLLKTGTSEIEDSSDLSGSKKEE